MSDADTLGTRESDDVGAAPRPPALACVTVLHHPDPERVGERAVVAAQEGGRPVLLSRNELALAHPDGRRPPAPLGDPHLSRAPIALRAGAGLTLEVPARARASIDGAPVEGTLELGRDRLERGALLSLKKRVLLYLHLTEVGPRPRDHGLTGESPAIRAVSRAVDRVADLDVPVLVRGETGTGKERVAQAIHRASGRAGALVAVNVATLSRELAAAELFGHAKGAFTGASERREGLFAAADRGTLFLDEVGELPGEVQPMLLRALETRAVRAIGGREERELDVRVIAATDADLERASEEGRFRAALYHRLRGFEIVVPPLRERREDVPRLVVELVREELARTGELERLVYRGPDAPPWMDRELMALLVGHAWPGNVRELRGVIRQVVVSSRGAPTLRADAATLRALAEGEARAEPVRAEVIAALRAHGWSFAKAARALGVSRSALYRRAEADPSLRTGGEIDREELERCLRAHAGDLSRTAEHLRISERALKLRLRALGLDG